MYPMLNASDHACSFSALYNAKHMDQKNQENNHFLADANINVDLRALSTKVHANHPSILDTTMVS